MENEVECRRKTGDDEFVQKEAVKLSQVLPEEVLTEILVRLPVKSLLRFRCVSKSFCTFIDSHYFINLHLNRSANDRTHLKLVFLERLLVSTNYNLAKLHFSDFDNGLEDKSLLGIRMPRLNVYGDCNGVFLLVASSFRLVLWNPSTQQHRDLPRCPVKRNPFQDKMGLAYDSTLDDYKVVLIACVGTFENRQVWIFGLRSNSWRMVPTDFFPKQGFFLPFGYFAHGELYWKCILDISNDSYSQDIVEFDVGKETLSLITQPLYPTKGRSTGLHVLDGCLCNSFISELGEAVLYVRKKDGAEFTWSILYSVTTAQLPPFLEINRFEKVSVLGYSKEGDKIMLNLGFRYMISYDLKERSFQTTTITCRISDEYCYAIPCLESLVSVGDGDLQRQQVQKRKRKRKQSLN